MTDITFKPGVRMPVLPYAADHSGALSLNQAFASRTLVEGSPARRTTTELYVDRLFGPKEGYASFDDALLGAAELTSGMEHATAIFDYDNHFFTGRLQWQLHDEIGMGLSPRQQINMEGIDPAEFTGFFGGTTPQDNFQVFQRSVSDARSIPLRAIVDGETVLRFELPEPPSFNHPRLAEAVQQVK